MPRFVTLIFGLSLALTGPAVASETVGGMLTATAACPAYQSKNQGTNPGAVRLVPGTLYKVLERNAPDGHWLRLIIPGAVPPERWVEEDCGTLAGSQAAATNAGGGVAPSPQPPAARVGLAPFFDTRDDGPGDMTPPPPTLGVLDRGLLAVCGPWGSRPNQRAFAAALLAAPQDLAAIRQAVGGAIRTAKPDDVTFAFELAALWFQEEAFAHVFCGEPNANTLGGMHFQARYWEAQEKGWAGALTRAQCAKVEIAPPVYTFGVAYYRRDGTLGQACPKGYGRGQDARALLTEATRAYLLSRRFERTDSRGQWQCVVRGKVGDGPAFAQQVYFKNGALRSVFPDASPAIGQVDCLTGLPWR